MTVDDLLFWITPWEPSAIIGLALPATAVAYLYGSLRAPSPAPARTAFWMGWGLLYASMLSGFDYFAQHVFFVHRLQHLVLHHVAPLLIVLSRPARAFDIVLPKGWHFKLSLLDGPLTAPLVFTLVTVVWLIPPVQQAAMLNSFLYNAMNVTLVLNGLMFWQACLYGRHTIPIRILMAAAIVPGQVAAGLLLVFAGHDLYPVFTLCGRSLSISPLTDQQMGGAVLWLSGAMMSLPVIAILARRMVQSSSAMRAIAP